MKGGECDRCRSKVFIDLHLDCFDFHHRNPKNKLFTLGKMNLLRTWKTVVKEASKCDLLCANCHREVEAVVRGKKNG